MNEKSCRELPRKQTDREKKIRNVYTGTGILMIYVCEFLNWSICGKSHFEQLARFALEH